MDTVAVGSYDGDPIYADEHAASADAILVANRIKPHTDVSGRIESGLSKMAVIRMGKHDGAGMMHDAALAGDMGGRDSRAGRHPLRGTTSCRRHRADRERSRPGTHIGGVPTTQILDREPALLERAHGELPMLLIDDLDLLVVNEMGKEVSGTGLDTNVLGWAYFTGESEPDRPDYMRVYVRSLTPPSHGNALRIGLVDIVHKTSSATLILATRI